MYHRKSVRFPAFRIDGWEAHSCGKGSLFFAHGFSRGICHGNGPERASARLLGRLQPRRRWGHNGPSAPGADATGPGAMAEASREAPRKRAGIRSSGSPTAEAVGKEQRGRQTGLRVDSKNLRHGPAGPAGFPLHHPARGRQRPGWAARAPPPARIRPNPSASARTRL